MRLIHGDALDVLPALEAGSVDAVITDPPYAQTNEEYDSAIACRPDVWRECYRVAKQDAALVAFAGSPTYHKIASAIEAGGWAVRQMWGWVYRDGMITSAYPREGFDRLAPAMDPIVYATKGKVLLSLAREGDPWEARFDRLAERRRYSGRAASHEARLKADGHWPRSIVSDGSAPFEYFAMSRGTPRADKNFGHPNQKPLALMLWLAKKVPVGTVLDPFMGSGTTGVAALAEGRDFIGIEKAEGYFAVAKARLGREQAMKDGRVGMFAGPPQSEESS